MFRSSAGCIPDCFANRVEPSSVSMTRSCAMWRGKPRWTAASMSASITRKTYVGPVPETAVAMATIFSSSTSISWPRAPSSAAAWARCSSVVSGVAYQTVMPLPSRAGVFGMLRTTWSWPRKPVRAAVVAPARTLSTSWPRRRCGPISRPTLASIWGLIPNRMTSAPSTASVFEATVRMPYSRSRCSRRSGRGWLATTWPGSTSLPRSMPAIIASAMTPEPTVAIVDVARGDIGRSIAAAPCP